MTPLQLTLTSLVVLALLVLLLYRRRPRRAAQDTAADAHGGQENRDHDDAASASADIAADAAVVVTATAFGLDQGQWRRAGRSQRLKTWLRGPRQARRLLNDPACQVFLHRSGDGICIAMHHDVQYGGRPQWPHVARLTLAMGRAEEAWPGSTLRGVLGYADTNVPVEYSPALFENLRAAGQAVDGAPPTLRQLHPESPSG